MRLQIAIEDTILGKYSENKLRNKKSKNKPWRRFERSDDCNQWWKQGWEDVHTMPNETPMWPNEKKEFNVWISSLKIQQLQYFAKYMTSANFLW